MPTPDATTSQHDALRGARLPSAFALLAAGTCVAALVVGAAFVWPVWEQRAIIAGLENRGAQVFVEQVWPDWMIDRLPESWRPGLSQVVEVIVPSDFGNDDLARIARIRKLRHLTLWYSRIDDAGLTHLANQRSLEGLVLDELDVSDDGLKTIAGLDRLDFLSLDGTRVTDGGMAHLGRLKRMKWLSLEGTAVTAEGLSALRGLSDLEILSLGGPAVCADGIGLLADFPHLRTIYLRDDGDRPGDALAALGKLDRLPRLSVVSLEGSAFTDEVLKPLVALPRVEYLTVCDVAVTDDGLRRLEQMGSLRTLTLCNRDQRPRFTREGVERLRRARPNLGVTTHGESATE